MYVQKCISNFELCQCQSVIDVRLLFHNVVTVKVKTL
jgi:hypothetical protein